MDDKFDGIVLTLFGYNIEFQQSIINWLILCVLFSIFFISPVAVNRMAVLDIFCYWFDISCRIFYKQRSFLFGHNPP